MSQGGQGWFPQPWWLIAQLRYCRPFTDLSPRSSALSHSLLQVILLATAAIIGAFSEHFAVNFVRSRSWIASFTSLRGGALSERIYCVKCVPNTSSNSLHSLTRQMDAVAQGKQGCTTQAGRVAVHDTLEETQLPDQHSATHYRDLQGSGSSSVGVVFWPFQDPLHQLPLKCLQPLPQNLCHYPVLAAVEQYRHHTRFKNRSGGEGADVSLESTNTAIVEKTASSLLNVFVHRLCCKEISLPPVAQALPHITSWHHRPFDFAHWRNNIASGRKVRSHT